MPNEDDLIQNLRHEVKWKGLFDMNEIGSSCAYGREISHPETLLGTVFLHEIRKARHRWVEEF